MSKIPTTPSKELVQEWIREANHNEPMFAQVAVTGYQAGVKDAIEACCKALDKANPGGYWSQRLRHDLGVE